jgi:hypothetical protein
VAIYATSPPIGVVPAEYTVKSHAAHAVPNDLKYPSEHLISDVSAALSALTNKVAPVTT